MVPVPPRAMVKVPVVPPTMGSPVALVRVPEEGVPKAPPFTTNAPALPVFTASAVATPVPRPVIPEMGRPVALVKVKAEGVPKSGVTKVGEVARTTSPVPVHVKREEVARAVGMAEAPVVLARTEFAAIAERETAPEEYVRPFPKVVVETPVQPFAVYAKTCPCVPE